MAGDGAELSGFLHAAGRSLSDAQRQLTGDEAGVGVATAMAISEVEIEVKATLDQTEDEMELCPVSSQEARNGGVDPHLVSTLRVRYVAVPGGGSSPPDQPRRHAAEVIAAVRERDDVVALAEILGELEFDAAFLPETREWLVRVTESGGRTVREIAVADSG